MLEFSSGCPLVTKRPMTMWRSILSSVALFVTLVPLISAARKDETCEVCIKVLKEIIAEIPSEQAHDPLKIGEVVREVCGSKKGKDHKFCFYIGALPESATSIMNEVTKPLSWSMPADKVCDRLRTKDQQVCELKYDKAIDWKTVDLNKLRVKELKNILSDWDAVCKGCTEKSEFVKKIEELKPKFVKDEL